MYMQRHCLHNNFGVSPPLEGGSTAAAVVQGQHKVVSPCEFRCQKFWYSVHRMLSLFRSLILFLASSGSLAVLAGSEAGLAVWVFLRVAKTR